MSAVPVHKPIVVTKPRPELRVEQGGKVGVLSRIGTKVFQLSLITLAVYLCSSMGGQVLMEKARREGLKAVSRAKEAVKSEALLRNQVQDLTSTYAIDTWAKENGYLAPEVLAAQDQQANGKEAH